MAEAVRFVCDRCQHSIEAWSDGNPYYIDEVGQKQHAYHPDHERLAKCIGNDEPHLCLTWGLEFNVDSRAPIVNCPKCGSVDISGTYQLEGRPCPYCKGGVFVSDPDFFCIS